MRVRAALTVTALVAGTALAGVTSATAAGATTTDAATRGAPTTAQSAGCPSIQLIGVPGNHYWIGPPGPNGLPELDPARPGAITTDVAELLRPEQDQGSLRYEQINDLADVGLVMSYERSHRRGVDLTTQRIQEIAAECPDTRFSIMGYSHGAGVAGDVLRDIGSGNGPIPAERLATGSLFADPYREQGDSVVGPPVNPNSSGVVAPREGDFGAATDRIQGFCQNKDLICDNDPDLTVLAPLARHFKTESSITLVPYVLELIEKNGVDPAKWAEFLDEDDMVNLAVKVGNTIAAVEEYQRMNYHGWYADPRLDVGGGRTAVQHEADRIRAALAG